jgi:hypothetical protein
VTIRGNEWDFLAMKKAVRYANAGGHSVVLAKAYTAYHGTHALCETSSHQHPAPLRSRLEVEANTCASLCRKLILNAGGSCIRTASSKPSSDATCGLWANTNHNTMQRTKNSHRLLFQQHRTHYAAWRGHLVAVAVWLRRALSPQYGRGTIQAPPPTPIAR